MDSELKLRLRNFIEEIERSGGQRLPSEIELAQNLGVSRPTLRRALDDLEQEGLVLRIHGKGTFLNREALKIKLSLSSAFEFSRMIEKSGFHSTVHVVRFEALPADKNIAQALCIPQGEAVYRTEKLYFADKHPAIVSIDYYAKALFPQNTIVEEAECFDSVFKLLWRKTGRRIVRDKIEIEVMSQTRMSEFSFAARQLECECALAFFGTNYDKENRPVLYDVELYDTKYIRFNLIREKSVYNQ